MILRSKMKNGFTRLNFSKKNFGGFTIIEVIMAISILTVGVLGVFAFISHFTEYTSISVSRFTASYLAQEGIEIVKNIRDGNWLKGSSWNDNLGTGHYQADYNSTNTLSAYGGNYLNIDSNDFYSYSSGTTTPFIREIQICTSTVGADGIIYVSSTVSWSERGRSHSVSAEEKIYNWYEE